MGPNAGSWHASSRHARHVLWWPRDVFRGPDVPWCRPRDVPTSREDALLLTRSPRLAFCVSSFLVSEPEISEPDHCALRTGAQCGGEAPVVFIDLRPAARRCKQSCVLTFSRWLRRARP